MGGGKKPEPDRPDKAKPPPPQPTPQPFAPQPMGNETRAEQVHSARAAKRQFDRMELDSLVIEEKMSPSSSSCPGLHACHAEPSKTYLEIVPPIDLEGHKYFPMDVWKIRRVWPRAGDSHRVPVLWGSIAKGYLTLQSDGVDRLTTVGGLQQLTFFHPAMPPRGGGSEPALAIDVSSNLITGGISERSTQGSVGPPTHVVNLLPFERLQRVVGLDDLHELAVGSYVNRVANGTLDFSLGDMTFKLDGVFPGTGSFSLANARPLQAVAEVEAFGVKKQEIAIDRDSDAQISAGRELTVDLVQRKRDGRWNGSLTARFARGSYDIRGTIEYTSPSRQISGNATVLLTDRRSAWAAIQQRLGDKAPPPELSGPDTGMALVGWGVLDFDLSKWLKGRAEVVVDPDGYITTRGKLEPTVTYKLFDRHDIPEDKLPGTSISIPKIPLIGDFIHVEGGFSFNASGWYGPGTLRDITAEGIYSTNPKIVTEFDVGASLIVPAEATLTIKIWGGIAVGEGPISGGIRIVLTGTGTLHAYAHARPHIARRRVQGSTDGSTEWLIHGHLDVAAALDCALSGKIELHALRKVWASVDLGGRTWRVTDFGVRLNFSHVIGSGKLPRVALGNDKGDVTFNDYKFMTAAVHDAAPVGSEKEAPAHDSFDDFETSKVNGELPPAHAPGTGAPDTGPTAETQASGPLAPAVDEPVGPRVRTPATGETMPSITPPPEAHAHFEMDGAKHELTLVFDDPPTIYMASPRGEQLSKKLAIATKAVTERIDAAKKGGASPDEHSLADLKAEHDTLQKLLKDCLRVEIDAARLGIHPEERLPAHVPGFTELAGQLRAYAALYDRKDLLTSVTAKAAPEYPAQQRPKELPKGKTSRLDELETIEPGVTERYLRDYQDYLVNGGEQDLLTYVEGRAARKLGRTVEPAMIKKFEETFNKSSKKLDFDVVDPIKNETRHRIPDIYVSGFAIGDVKDVAYQSLDEQMRDDLMISKGGEGVRRTGTSDWLPENDPIIPMHLIVRDASHLGQKKTEVSEPLLREIERTRGEVHWWIPDPKVR